MKISIAMCTYNGEKYLLKQLQSIAEQTILPEEVVICDDASTDNTRSVVLDYKAVAPYEIKFHSNKVSLGVTANFGKALSLCNGDIIFLSDQDDIWLPHKIETTLVWFEKNPQKSLVFSDGCIINEKLATINTLWRYLRFSVQVRHEWQRGNAFQHLVEKGNYVMGMATAIRKELLSTALPFASMHQWIHDGQLALRATMMNKAGYMSDQLVQYRRHQNQVMGIREEKSLRQVVAHKIKNLQWIKQDENLQSDLDDLQTIETWVKQAGIDRAAWVVSNKLKHLEKRRRLTQGTFLPRVFLLGEWINGNYKRYTCGRFGKPWIFVVKDIFGR